MSSSHTKIGSRVGSIETSTYPLVFKAKSKKLDLVDIPRANGMVEIRTWARPLAGMQKEAIVQCRPGGVVWRIVCDEGPWLNGTDLAPFPLAFFTAGLAASFISAFVEEARGRDEQVDSVRIEQDNFFTMEGSALRGTMVAGAQPVEVTFSASGNASASQLQEIAEIAVHGRSPAECCLRQTLASGFAVRANNEELLWPGEPANRVAALADPTAMFEQVRPASTEELTIIHKTGSPGKLNSDAVGLQARQKRIVHVHTECTIREDGLKSIIVECIQPAGSRFEILSDNSRAAGGQGRAPSGLEYLSAGVAFCFMTQIDRYAQITKQKLNGYNIIQDTGFRLAQNCKPDAHAAETLVCLNTEEPRDKSLQLIRTAEQTCYVHASYRIPARTELKFRAL